LKPLLINIMESGINWHSHSISLY